jgi:RND family efflux transporter MFP subunit
MNVSSRSPRRVAKSGSFVRRAVIALVILAAAAIGWWLLARGPQVQVALAERGDAAQVVYATGIVEPLHWAKVTALQRKRIIDICKCEGRAVRKGEIVARLDDAEERAVLTELEARLERLRADAERISTLVERNAASRIAYDEKLTEVREYEARIEAQNNRIGDLQLKSPVDGIVLRRDGEVGEVAGTGADDVLMWVGQPKPLRIVAEVNEDDIGRVKQGQKVLVRHEGYDGGTLEATMASLTPMGDPRTKTFRVYLALPGDTPLMIGMSVEANIVVDEAEDAVLVPAEAIHGAEVWVVEAGRATRRSVETGIRGTRMVEIRRGLEPGETVLSPYLTDLEDGARVRTGPAVGG